MKISNTQHVTKNGVLKKNPISLKKEIKELIKIRNDITRSDLQGMAEVPAMRIAPSDWQLQNEISNRILVIVDNADNFTDEQIDYHISQLEEDIKRVL